MREDESVALKEPVTEKLAAKTLTSAIWLLGSRMVSRAAGVISTLILARVLVPSDFGIVAMATTFSAIVDALSQIGVQDALVRRQEDNRDLFHTAYTLQVGRGVLTACILAAAGPIASWWFGEPRLVPMLLALAGISVISSLENVGIAEFRRTMRYNMVFALLAVPRLISIVAAITAALLLKSYWALLIGMATSATVRTVLSHLLHPFRPRLAIHGWRLLAAFSFWIWTTCLVGIVWERIDVFVLGPIFGKAQLGMYVIAVELASLPVTELVAPAAEALFSGFARAQKDGGSSLHHAPLVASMLIMFIMPLTVTISCGSGFIIAVLLGPHWASARILVSILAWLCLFSPITSVCNSVLIANGRVSRTFYGRAIAAVVKLLVLVVAVSLTKRIEVVAAAMTACVAVESCAFLFLFTGSGDVRVRTMLGPLARTLSAGILVVLILNGLGLAWQPVVLPASLALVYGAALGAFVTLLYVLFVGLFWYCSGRPRGPETRLLDLAGEFLRPLFLRVSHKIGVGRT